MHYDCSSYYCKIGVRVRVRVKSHDQGPSGISSYFLNMTSTISSNIFLFPFRQWTFPPSFMSILRQDVRYLCISLKYWKLCLVNNWVYVCHLLFECMWYIENMTTILSTLSSWGKDVDLFRVFCPCLIVDSCYCMVSYQVYIMSLKPAVRKNMYARYNM